MFQTSIRIMVAEKKSGSIRVKQLKVQITIRWATKKYNVFVRQ